MTPHIKTCFRCGVDKPCSDFYTHPKMGDGYLGKCKSCTKKEAIANRLLKVEYYRAYDKSRVRLPHRIQLRKEVLLQEKEEFPEKIKARQMVSNALRDGKLTKEPCVVCGTEKVHAHHTDYSKPLQVRWLCAAHHKQEHLKERAT